MPPKKKTSSKFRLNIWIVISVVLLIAFAGFIFYDKSPTFQRNINYIFGIENPDNPYVHKLDVIVLTDLSLDPPPYDVQELLEDFENEPDATLVVDTIDINDSDGQKLIKDLEITTVPLVIFDERLELTGIYEKFSQYFVTIEDKHLLRLKPFKYLKLPEPGNGQTKGKLEAPVTIIEYSSFTCGYCAQMAPIFEKIVEEYPNEVLYVYKHYDRGGLDTVLENASECAGEQEKFWEMHDYIFGNTELLSSSPIDDFLKTASAEIGLSENQFISCVEESKYAQKIANQTNEAFNFGVSGTPGIFINDEFIPGAASFETLKSVIDKNIQ